MWLGCWEHLFVLLVSFNTYLVFVSIRRWRWDGRPGLYQIMCLDMTREELFLLQLTVLFGFRP